jgi:hypothetical protein
MKDTTPVISCRLPPARTLKKRFIFPLFVDDTDSDQEPDQNVEEDDFQTTSMLGTSQTTIEAAQANVLSEGLETLTSHSIPVINGGHAVAGPSTLSQGTTVVIPSSSSSGSSPFSLPWPSPPVIAEPLSPVLNPNPYPFPPWYPESAHFVRQWWPTLPNIPRVSCTVVLLAAHDQLIHRTRFVLAQHYFRVPLDRKEWANGYEQPLTSAEPKDVLTVTTNGVVNSRQNSHLRSQPSFEEIQDDVLMHLWYVSTPFEVMRLDPEDEEDGATAERPRPLVAVDFGHAVWIEYVDIDVDEEEEEEDQGDEDVLEGGMRRTGTVKEEDRWEETSLDTSGNEGPIEATTEASIPGIDQDPKRLRFVTFPPFVEELETAVSSNQKTPTSSSPSTTTHPGNRNLVNGRQPGVVYTLLTPPGLQLSLVETINIDQSQGAIILSDKLGKIWILCYE